MWLCPHRLFKKGNGTMLDVEKDYEKDKQPGDTDTAQMWCDVGIWGVPGLFYGRMCGMVWRQP